MKRKKYGVYVFPSWYGTPFFTNYYWLALLIAYWRMFFNAESRIIDENDNHLLVL